MSKFESGMEAMVDMYIYETTTLLEQLDQILMKTESASEFESEDINEIFRIMHTIKGSSAMMGLENMSSLAHAIEDMFYIIREDKPIIKDIKKLYELVFNASDLLKAEIDLIQEDEYTATDFSAPKNSIESYVTVLKSGEPESVQEEKPAPKAEAPSAPVSSSSADEITVKVYFDDDCKMENLRALILINKIKDDCEKLSFEPADIEDNPDSSKVIIENGFLVHFKSHTTPDVVISGIEEALNVKSY